MSNVNCQVSKAEVIPSINVRTFEEVKERIAKIEPHVQWCHLDVTDGIFSKHLTWHDPRDLLNFETSLNVEVHLMVSEPEKIIDQWLVKPIKRLIFHIEAMKDPEFIIKKCREAGMEIGFAVNPETFWGKLEPWFDKVDVVQTLAVKPGPSGQGFGEIDDSKLGQELTENITDKIIHIRKSCPKCIIEVDGGINPETAKKVVDAGANLLVVGNYIFSSPDIEKAIADLRV